MPQRVAAIQPNSRGHRDRIGQTPACVAAARWADQDRLVGHPEIPEHVLVGQVIAEGNQAGFSA